MLNPITHSLDEVKFRIPRQILNKVFLQRPGMPLYNTVSLDSQIASLVIRPRVLVNCNLVGGEELRIPLISNAVEMEEIDLNVRVFRIPKTLTGGRSILSVIDITYQDPTGRMLNGGTSTKCGSPYVMQAAGRLMDSHGPSAVTGTSQIELIAENVVMLRDGNYMPANATLNCLIANDENMSNLQPKNYRAFADLCVAAVKAYIYNEYLIDMDEGELRGGQQLGAFRSVIEGYSDAEQIYQDILKLRMQKVLFMNDRPTYFNHIKAMVGGYR